MHQVWVRDPKKTISELVKEVSAKTGEKIKVSRFVRYQLGET
jgi:elongation factor Ts